MKPHQQKLDESCYTTRDELQRRLHQMAAKSSNEQEFASGAHHLGVEMLLHYASDGSDRVVGYSAALPCHPPGRLSSFIIFIIDHDVRRHYPADQMRRGQV